MKTRDLKICARLAEERKRLNLNQIKVADYCEVSVKTVGRWEKNIPIPADKLSMLAQLGYDITYILTDIKLAPQVAGLEAASRAWQAASSQKTGISSEQETWLSLLESLAGGDRERLKQIGLALVGYSQSKLDNTSS